MNFQSSKLCTLHKTHTIAATFLDGLQDAALVPESALPCNASVSVDSKVPMIGLYISSSAVGGALFMLIVIITTVVMVKCIQRWKHRQTECKQIQSAHIISQLNLNHHDISHGSNNRITLHASHRPPVSHKTGIVASNPIYEGVVYETTPGESFKSLQSSPSTPTADSALSNRYTFGNNTPDPMLLPPRKLHVTAALSHLTTENEKANKNSQ